MVISSLNIGKIKSILGLSFQLAKTNFKLRNEGSYLGILWYLLEPTISFAVLLIVGRVLSQDSIPNYPIYLFIGLIMFNFFNAVTNFSAKTIIDNGKFIKSIKINPEVFVVSGIMQFLFSHFFEVVLVVALGAFLKMNIFWFLFYPIILFFFCLFIIGVSFMLSVFSVYVTDLKNVWTVFTRLLWFITPVFYTIPTSGLIHTMCMLNPMYHFINITRDLLIFHRILDAKTFLFALVSSATFFIVGIVVFEKSKNKLAERL